MELFKMSRPNDLSSADEEDVQAQVNNALDAIGCLGVVVSLDYILQ